MLTILIGYFGESVPFNSGLITVVKGHGHYFSGYPGNTGVQPISRENETIEQILETNGNGIILIRNPYHVIVGYRHQLLAPGHTEHAKASAFIGKGRIYGLCILYLFDNTKSKVCLRVILYFLSYRME